MGVSPSTRLPHPICGFGTNPISITHSTLFQECLRDIEACFQVRIVHKRKLENVYLRLFKQI